MREDTKELIVCLILLLVVLLPLTCCGTRPAFKFAVAGIGADSAITEYGIEYRDMTESRSFLQDRTVRLTVNAASVGLCYWYQRHEKWPDWPLWAVGGLRFIIFGYNLYLMESRQ